MAGTRPATISELASFAQTDPDLASSSNRELGHYLRRAETHRKSGKALASTAGTGPNTSGDIGTDLERAFVEYARAATLIVEKIPGHGDYTGTLSAEQRANLTAVGTFFKTLGFDIVIFSYIPSSKPSLIIAIPSLRLPTPP
ncbi:hypothetical protein B0H11DRAFT_1710429 [Mycena galericulata]|nr:hypothetical protein B0H11DRAFT_1710429 [Mycena galericulata]